MQKLSTAQAKQTKGGAFFVPVVFAFAAGYGTGTIFRKMFF